LLVWWDSLLVLDLGLDVFDGVARLDFKGNGLSSQGLHEDLHTTTESKDKVKGRLFLDVVVTQGSTILELFSSKDETLLVWWNSLLVLNLGLHVFNGVAWLNLQGDGLSGQGLHKDLHTATKSKDKVKG